MVDLYWTPSTILISHRVIGLSLNPDKFFRSERLRTSLQISASIGVNVFTCVNKIEKEAWVSNARQKKENKKFDLAFILGLLKLLVQIKDAELKFNEIKMKITNQETV